MTNKTTTKQAAGALTLVSDGLHIRKGKLVPTPALLEALELAQSLQNDLDEFYGSIKTFLEIHKCKGGEGEWGYVKLSPQRRLYADSTVKPRFLKKTVDTDEVRHYQKKHSGKLPAGITEKSSNRLIKKVNA